MLWSRRCVLGAGDSAGGWGTDPGREERPSAGRPGVHAARRRVLFCVGLVAVALCLVSGMQSADAAPILGSGSFALQQQGTEVILDGTFPVHVGVLVQSTSGPVHVEREVTGGWEVLGTVGSGSACLFEGTYQKLRVRADTQAAHGTYENRGPIPTGDSTVGEADGVSIVGNTRIYRANSTAFRIVSFHATSGDFEVRASSTGSVIGTVRSGDDGFVYAETTEFWISGSGTINFHAHTVPEVDVTGPDVDVTGKLRGDRDHPIDDWDFDGRCCWAGEIKNTGKGDCTVTVTYKGTTPTTSTLKPGEIKPVSCFITEIGVTFTAAGTDEGEVTFSFQLAAVDPPPAPDDTK